MIPSGQPKYPNLNSSPRRKKRPFSPSYENNILLPNIKDNQMKTETNYQIFLPKDRIDHFALSLGLVVLTSIFIIDCYFTHSAVCANYSLHPNFLFADNLWAISVRQCNNVHIRAVLPLSKYFHGVQAEREHASQSNKRISHCLVSERKPNPSFLFSTNRLLNETCRPPRVFLISSLCGV